MRKDNIFVFGGEVSGESFIGRKADVAEVIKRLQEQGKNSKGVAFIGMNRIGKSSLVNKVVEQEFIGRDDVVLLRESVNVSDGANYFWHKLTTLLSVKLSDMDIRDDRISENLDKILEGDVESKTWSGSVFQIRFDRIMKRLKELGYRVVLVLDEFDKARELFCESPGSLGVIRDLATKAENGVTVITISRRRLHMIEQNADPSSSTLNESFDKYYVAPFKEMDMWDYHAALSDYDISFDSEQKEKLTEYTGNHPYLLSLYANRMAEMSKAGEEVDLSAIERIHDTEYGANIRDYYTKLIERMSEDGYTEKLRGALCGPIRGITQDDISVLESSGYLSCDQDGYYIISKEFTRYFLEITKDLRIPAWEAIMLAERKLKDMVRKVYPRLEEYRYSEIRYRDDWAAEINGIYSEIAFKEDMVRGYMENAMYYGQDATVVDVLNFGYLKKLIENNWEKFRGFFKNRELSAWQKELDLIYRARNPLAHAHPEYLSDRENEQLDVYCKQIIELEV